MLASKIQRYFSTTSCLCKKVVPNNLKGRSTSSQQWLTRQLSDPYVEKAKMMNYRCRSAFKLIEIDDRFHILHPGQVVIDCGAAPGSWTQIAVQKTNALGSLEDPTRGTVIAIDKQLIYPIDGAIVLGNMDFTTPEAQDRLRTTLGDKQADIVISDMAPSASGVRDLDNENIIQLCYSAVRFAVQVSKVNASLLIKLWQCGEAKRLEEDMSRFYKNVKFVKPTSSRSDSAEVFLLGREFKGLKVS